MNFNLAYILIYSGMLEISYGLHNARSYPHLYLLLEDPLQGSLYFFFLYLIVAGIMVLVYNSEIYWSSHGLHVA